MKSIVKHCWVAGLLLLAAPGLAEDQVPWVADFQTACGMAAEQRRLVLLHFYNDNCGPCVRLEQNVFNRPDVGEAVAQNYLAVKVHAGKNPQLATRYRINQWPTDVFVTPSGLEVHRAVSDQNPAKYIAVLNQVAQQTGVGAGRQWKSQMAQTLKPTAAATAATANNVAAGLQQTTQQATGAVQGAANQAQKGWGAAVQQFQKTADQGRDTAQQAAQQVTATVQQTAQQATTAAQQTQQQATNTVQKAADATKQWSQQATDAVQHYEQQAGDSYRQFREQAGQTGQQIQQQAQTTKQELRSATQKAAEEVADASQRVKSQWQQASQSPFDRRSAFVPLDSSPAAESVAAAQVAPPAASPSQLPANPSPPAAPAPAAAPNQGPLLTHNPWVTSKPSEPPTPATPPTVAKQTLVPASQAPPLALDGFCPVTLLETMASNPSDRAAWKKGDRKFGAIHRGRTYLFVSADQQQKFLANPDAYAPTLAGCDPVRFAERGEMVDGKRAYGLVTPDRRIYLFADEASRSRFEQSPAAYSNAIQQAMLRSESGNTYR